MASLGCSPSISAYHHESQSSRRWPRHPYIRDIYFHVGSCSPSDAVRDQHSDPDNIRFFIQTHAQSDQGPLRQTALSVSSTSNPKTSESQSQSPTQISGNQTPAVTGDYALTVGSSGEVGLQSVPTGSAQTSAGIAEDHTTAAGLTTTQGGLTTLGPIVTPVGNYGDGGLRPWITSSSNGTLGGNGTTWNSSSVQPYLGGANRRMSEATGWWLWSSTAILAVAWL